MANKKTKTQKKLTPVRFIYTTWPDEKSVADMSRSVLEKGLAACVNSWVISSHYSWKGQIEASKEFVALVKTDAKRLAKCRSFLRQLHPYETPCLITLTPTDCNPEYEAWLLGSK